MPFHRTIVVTVPVFLRKKKLLCHPRESCADFFWIPLPLTENPVVSDSAIVRYVFYHGTEDSIYYIAGTWDEPEILDEYGKSFYVLSVVGPPADTVTGIDMESPCTDISAPLLVNIVPPYDIIVLDEECDGSISTQTVYIESSVGLDVFFVIDGQQIVNPKEVFTIQHNNDTEWNIEVSYKGDCPRVFTNHYSECKNALCEPIKIEILDVDCLYWGEGINVELKVSGGNPDPETGYQTDELGLEFFPDQVVTYYVSNDLLFTFQVEDMDGCSAYIEELLYCYCCLPILTGEMPEDTLFICSADIENTPIQMSYTILDDNNTIVYGIYPADTEGDDAETPIAFNPDGIFNPAEIEGLNYNTIYYVSAVSGMDYNLDAYPDNIDECRERKGKTPVIYYEEGNCECGQTLPNILLLDIDISSAGFYVLKFSVSGGTPYDYGYIIEGENINDNTDNLGNPFEIVSEDNLISLTASDKSGCEVLFELEMDDNVFPRLKGQLSQDTSYVCSKKLLYVSMDYIETDSTFTQYALYAEKDSVDDLDIPIYKNTDGFFNFNNIPGIQYNIVYLISVLNGKDKDGDGNLDNDEWLERSNNMPLVFLSPLEAETGDIICDDLQENFEFPLHILGGSMPAYNESTSYYLNGMAKDTGAYIFTFDYSLNDTLFTIEDGAGCNISLAIENPCVLDCKDIAAILGTDTLKVCTGETAMANIFSPAQINEDMSSVSVFVLHQKASNDLLPEDILNFNNTGLFSKTEELNYFVPYFITNITGPDVDNDGLPELTHSCTDLSNAQTLLFYPDFNLAIQDTLCDEQEGIMQYWVSVNCPDCLTGSTFVLSDIVNETLKADEDIIFEVNDNTFWQLNASLSNTGCSISISDTAKCDKLTGGLSETDKTKRVIRVFPNPAKEEIYILIHYHTINNTITQLKVYDLNGKLCYQQPFSEHHPFSHQIDVKNWTSGIYFLAIQTKDGKVLRERIAVQK